MRVTDAVVFDWAMTLFEPSVELAELVALASGISVGKAEPIATRLTEEVREAELIDHGYRRDLSAEAHRRFYSALTERVGLHETPSDALYDSLTRAWTPFPDVGETFAALSARGVGVGVLSNVGFDIRPLFGEAGLDRFVDAYVLSYEHGHVKPEPRAFEIALEALGVSPGSALMVGDTPSTDGGAVRVGMTTMLLPAWKQRGEVRGLGRVLDLVVARKRSSLG